VNAVLQVRAFGVGPTPLVANSRPLPSLLLPLSHPAAELACGALMRVCGKLARGVRSPHLSVAIFLLQLASQTVLAMSSALMSSRFQRPLARHSARAPALGTSGTGLRRIAAMASKQVRRFSLHGGILWALWSTQRRRLKTSSAMRACMQHGHRFLECPLLTRTHRSPRKRRSQGRLSLC
jgi:hypothetical protein